MSAEKIPTMCHGCFYGGYSCGILAHVKNGVFVRVEGNPYNPLNKGKLCAKGLAAVQWVYNPQRLKYPLIRVGKKGGNEFKRTSWDNALDIICERLTEIKEKWGPEYIILVKGQASGWFNLYHQLFLRFLHALGSPNFSWWGPSVCYLPQLFYHICTIGGDRYATADYENADLIIEWFTGGGKGGPARGGVESGNVNLRTPPIKILDRLRDGAKLIIINPQLIPLGANGRAHKWLPIRPGTDGALALAMINVIVNDELYDKEFVKNWCVGFEELKEHIKQYTPDWAEKITDIPREAIIDLARDYATTKRACIRITEAPQKRDLPCFAKAIPILIAITGHLDRPGGNVFFHQVADLHIDTFEARISKETANKALGAGRAFAKIMGDLSLVGADFSSIINALITGFPYKPKAAIIVGSNPLSTARNPELIKKALREFEFTVVIDVVPTPTTRYADVILPAATKYEHEGDVAIRFDHLSLCNKVIEPLWETRSEIRIFLDLACRLGMGKDFWNGNYDAMLNEYLMPVNLTIDELRENSLKGIYLPRTEFMDRRERYKELLGNLPNEKVQLYNFILKKNGFDPLPTYQGEIEDPLSPKRLISRYPLIFTDQHSDYLNHHSWMRSVPWLREIRSHSFIKINPKVAREYGIKNGDWVEIESPHGKMKAVALIFEGIRPDTIMGHHGWWEGCSKLGIPEFSPLNGGVNPNVLYDWTHRDLLTGDIAKNTLVRIKKTLPPEAVTALEEVK